jgi:hypothetical protein
MMAITTSYGRRIANRPELGKCDNSNEECIMGELNLDYRHTMKLLTLSHPSLSNQVEFSSHSTPKDPNKRSYFKPWPCSSQALHKPQSDQAWSMARKPIIVSLRTLHESNRYSHS